MTNPDREEAIRKVSSFISTTYKGAFGLGVALGVCGMIALNRLGSYFSPPEVNSIRTFPSRQEQPSIMRLYKSGTDRTFIRSPTDSTRYIILLDYLKNNFPNSSERNLERARIELLVSQEEAK